MTGLYYQDSLVSLYHGSCREVLTWLDADVLITDPPYGIAYNSGSRRTVLAKSILNDESTETRDAALELWGTEKAALVFGSWRKPKPVATRTLLVWDTKGALGMGDLTIPWKPSHQEIYVLNRHGWTGKRTTDVLVFPPVQSMSRNGRLHPHQKPVPLLEELASKTVGVIADPFAGVGSTLLAARNLGRQAIGVELDERYCEMAAKRFEAVRDSVA